MEVPEKARGKAVQVFVKPLGKSIEAHSDFRNNMYVMENKELDITSMGPTYEDCLKDFEEEVVFVYKEYGLANDDDLTQGARRLKQTILRMMGKDAKCPTQRAH